MAAMAEPDQVILFDTPQARLRIAL